MKKGSTWFLRGVLLLMAIIGLALAIFALPSIYQGIPKEFSGLSVNLILLFIGGLYAAAIPFFVALYQALRLLNNIDKDIAFSESSVNALKYIKYSAVAMTFILISTIPLLFQIAELDDAPGLGAVSLAFTCSPLVIATFAAVLQKLLENAINIKSENELTV